jgi:hypothetical protein
MRPDEAPSSTSDDEEEEARLSGVTRTPAEPRKSDGMHSPSSQLSRRVQSELTLHMARQAPLEHTASAPQSWLDRQSCCTPQDATSAALKQASAAVTRWRSIREGIVTIT